VSFDIILSIFMNLIPFETKFIGLALILHHNLH